jgi:hypothetical protein
MLGIILSIVILNAGLPDVDLWLDRENAEYYPTENLKVYFQTDEDCYIAVYNIEMGGRESLLFPLEGESGWVEAGRTYELPPPDGDYDYVVRGSPGVEKVVVVASVERLPELDDQGPDIVHEVIDVYVLEPEPATLRIITAPKGARIFVTDVETGNEEYMGKAPETIVLRPGEYYVELHMSGFKVMRRKLWLDPGERRRIFATLRPY